MRLRCVLLLGFLVLVVSVQAKRTPPTTTLKNVIDMDKIAALSDNALEEITSEAGDLALQKMKTDLPGAKKLLLQMASASLPVWKAFFEFREKVAEINAAAGVVITGLGVGRRAPADKPATDENAYAIYASVGRKEDVPKVKWPEQIPQKMREVAVLPPIRTIAKLKAKRRAALAQLPQGNGGKLKDLLAAKGALAANQGQLAPQKVKLASKRRHLAKWSSFLETSVINNGEVFLGSSVAVDDNSNIATGALGFIFHCGGKKYAATNGHACFDMRTNSDDDPNACQWEGVKMHAEEHYAGVINNDPDLAGHPPRAIGKSTIAKESAEMDTCAIEFGTASACETLSGRMSQYFTALEDGLCGVNVLIKRLVTQFGAERKFDQRKRSYGYISHYGDLDEDESSCNAVGGYTGRDQYLISPFTPPNTFDDAGGVPFGIAGDSGSGVWGYGHPALHRAVAQYFGESNDLAAAVPIHTHKNFWAARLGCNPTLCV